MGMTSGHIFQKALRLVGAGGLCLVVGCGATATDDADGSGLASGEDISNCAIVVGGHCITDDVQDECGLDTGYDGDVMCLKPPAPEDGFQMHIGPTEYTKEGMAEYVLPPGEEGIQCAYIQTPNDKLVTYYERLVHMRPVSHHLIVRTVPADLVPAGYDGGLDRCANQSALGGSFGGSQSVRAQYPTNGIYPPEYADVGRALPSRQWVHLELHYLNTTDSNLLREIWMNVYYKSSENVSDWINDVYTLGSVFLTTKAGAHVVNANTLTLTDDVRIVNFFGHSHAHTTRFSIWREHDGERDLQYEDFDWFDPTTFAYNSVVQNPESDRERGIPGAASGILAFQKGDKLYWECEVVNDSDVDLSFSDQAITGEMCNVFGEMIGSGGINNPSAGSPGIEIPIDVYNEQM